MDEHVAHGRVLSVNRDSVMVVGDIPSSTQLVLRTGRAVVVMRLEDFEQLSECGER